MPRKSWTLENKKILWIIYIFFLIINTIVGYQRTIMMISPDELNTLAFPAYLSGNDWTSLARMGKSYYGWGQSILYLPFFLLIQDGILLYRLIIVLNGAIIALVPVFAYKISTEIFNITDKKILILLSVFTGLYPRNLTLSKHAWNETIIVLIPFVLIYLLMSQYIKMKNSKRNSAIIALLMIWGYSAHTRFISVIVSTILLIILVFSLEKKCLINIKYFSTTLISAFFLNELIKKWVVSLIQGSEAALPGSWESSITNFFNSLSNSETVINLIRAFSTYWYYIIITSMGLVLVGLVLYIKMLKNKTLMLQNKTTFYFLSFVFVDMLLAILIAISFFANTFSMPNVGRWLYGRYTDYLSSLFVLGSVIAIIRLGWTRRESIIGISGLVIYTGLTLYLELPDVEKSIITDWNIYTLAAFMPEMKVNSQSGLTIAFLILLILSIILSCFFCKKRFRGMLFIGCVVWCVVYIRSSYDMIYRNNKEFAQIKPGYEFFCELQDIDETYKTLSSNSHWLSYQSVLKNFTCNYVNPHNKIENIDENSFFISDRNWNLDYFFDDFYRVQDKKLRDNYLWIKGEGLAEELRSRNIKVVKSNSIYYSFSDLSILNDEKEFKRNGIVQANGVVHGPYIFLKKGNYDMEIRGNNLNDDGLKFSVFGINESGEKEEIPLNLILTYEKITGQFVLENDYTGIEYIFMNGSESPIQVKGIFLQEYSGGIDND